MTIQSLTDSLDNHHADFLAGNETKPYALSVFSHPTDGIAPICRRAWPILKHKQIRVSTVGTVRKLGYDVLPDGRKGHCLIPTTPPPINWSTLTQGFLPPQPNPERQRKDAKEVKST